MIIFIFENFIIAQFFFLPKTNKHPSFASFRSSHLHINTWLNTSSRETCNPNSKHQFYPFKIIESQETYLKLQNQTQHFSIGHSFSKTYHKHKTEVFHKKNVDWTIHPLKKIWTYPKDLRTSFYFAILTFFFH